MEDHVPWGLAMTFEVGNGPMPSTSVPPPPADMPKCYPSSGLNLQIFDKKSLTPSLSLLGYSVMFLSLLGYWVMFHMLWLSSWLFKDCSSRYI